MSEPTTTHYLRRPTRSRQKFEAQAPATEAGARLDTSFLETLIGYNARRAALTVIAEFLPRMGRYGLRPVEFSVLTLIGDNTGVTSRQLCAELDILPPNLVGLVRQLEKLGLVEKREHPSDRRAQSLHLTDHGQSVLAEAKKTAYDLEIDSTPGLTVTERKTLIRLLRKIYLSDANGSRPVSGARPATSQGG
jgi:DNA-binding MarR family transcriptional regulator